MPFLTMVGKTEAQLALPCRATEAVKSYIPVFPLGCTALSICTKLVRCGLGLFEQH